MENMWMVLFWTGPIGIFLLCLGVMIFLIAKASEISKRTKKEYPDK